MPEKWTGTVVGKMHVNCITYDELAAKLGYTKAYISMILNGSRRPAGAKQKFQQALDELIQQKTKANGGT
jgi:transcriptional regulator with XRE-family HTH domain